MAVGAYIWGTEYVRFSQTSGGVLHIKADAGGTPDDKTTIRMSRSSVEFRFVMPQKVLDAQAEKIRQNVRGYTHSNYLKMIDRKGRQKVRREKLEVQKRYYRRHRQARREYNRKYYQANREKILARISKKR